MTTPHNSPQAGIPPILVGRLHGKDVIYAPDPTADIEHVRAEVLVLAELVLARGGTVPGARRRPAKKGPRR